MALGRQGDHSAATLQQGKRRAKSTRRFVPVAVTKPAWIRRMLVLPASSQTRPTTRAD